MSHTPQVTESPSDLEPRRSSVVPGLALAVAVAVVATVVGRWVPVVGGPVAGIVVGVALASRIAATSPLRPGIRFASTTVLQASVVVLGSQLSLGQIARVGLASLPVMVGTLAAALLGAFAIGRWLGVSRNLRTLIGVGTGICGASAIAAVAPVIGAASAEVAYAVSTIFVFNVSAVLVFPALGHLLGLSQHAFGLFAGTAVNDMSSVVATATTYGAAAASYAVVVKLTRTLFIIPVSLGLAALRARDARGPRVRIGRLVPRFLIGFLIVAAANTAGLIPTAVHPALSQVSVFLITVALAAVGLSTDLGGLRRAGPRPLVLGAALWIVVCLTSLGLQQVTGTL